MEWTDQQARAIDRACDWWNNDRFKQQVHRIFGYAGAGKTELAKEIARRIGRTQFGAYTGKAASVLRQRGCDNASTIHSLIYTPVVPGLTALRQLEQQFLDAKAKPDTHPDLLERLRRAIEEERESTNRMAFLLNPLSDVANANLMIIDECSMIDSKVGEDLLSFGTPVLVLGDPAQLPPVRGQGFFTQREPDTMLTEIHRQARDNPIIQMATTVRQGGRLDLGEYGSSRVVMRSKIQPEDAMAASQILCGKNATRRAINLRCRSLLNRPRGEPVAGDRLVCLANDHDVGLLNGTLWELLNAARATDKTYDFVIRSLDDEARELGCEAVDHFILGRDGELNWWEASGLQQFDYGYALTCHKAQGSQWPNVMVFDESWVFKADRNRWLYTALTRAQEAVTVVRD